MFNRELRVGTRKSPLALKQVEEIIKALADFYPAIRFKIIGIDTYGDKDRINPISEIEGSDFFTREIEQALLGDRIDFAVHSAKDLADQIPQGLVIAAITKSIDPFDALVLRQSSVPTLPRTEVPVRKVLGTEVSVPRLRSGLVLPRTEVLVNKGLGTEVSLSKDVVEGLVSKGNSKIDELKNGARIGTSSLRRKTQLKAYRDDLQIVDIRGNIKERIEKLENDGLDAIVAAACALVRLGLEDRIAQRIPFEILSPHPLQGALAIEVREDNKELIKLLEVLNEK